MRALPFVFGCSRPEAGDRSSLCRSPLQNLVAALLGWLLVGLPATAMDMSAHGDDQTPRCGPALGPKQHSPLPWSEVPTDSIPVALGTRKELESLSPEEAARFRAVFSELRARDTRKQGVPDYPLSGFKALASVHGATETDLKHLPQSPAQEESPWCQCPHEHFEPESGVGNPPDDVPMFLLWHRAYVRAFEMSLQSLVKQRYGESAAAHFRLPYWDWIRHPAVPELFRNEFYIDSDGTRRSNPFYSCDRYQYASDGKPVFSPHAKDIDPFGIQLGNNFGYFSVSFFRSWHQMIHSNVGDAMYSPTTAAFDPVFWVHHTNIDRLWMHWVASDSKRRIVAEKTAENIWKSRNYRFPVTLSGVTYWWEPTYSDLAVNETEALTYRYDTLEIPKAATEAPEVPIAPAARSLDLVRATCSLLGSPPARNASKPQTVTIALAPTVNSEHRLEIDAAGLSIKIPFDENQKRWISDSVLSSADSRPFFSAFLSLIGANVQQRESSIDLYQVYLDLPSLKIDDGTTFQDHFLGTINLFGGDGATQFFGLFRQLGAIADARAKVRGEGKEKQLDDLLSNLRIWIFPVVREGTDSDVTLKSPPLILTGVQFQARGSHVPTIADPCSPRAEAATGS